MKEHTTITYGFDELSESAQERAIDAMREKLSGPWWGSEDNDSLGEAMLYAYGQALGTPMLDSGDPDFGSDFSLHGWDIGRGERFDVEGTLTRTNAPLLPWVDAIDSVRLNHRGVTAPLIDVRSAEGLEEQEEHDDMVDAIQDAAHHAIVAGRDELEYRNSDEYVREMIAANEWQFTESGDFYEGA